jgi:hypothetical protein
MSEEAARWQHPPPMVLKFPAGIDNRSREYALAEDAARSIENMDVTRDGGLISRLGSRKVVSGDCSSLWSHPNGRFALLVRDGDLVRLNPDETLTQLAAVSGPVVYATLNDEVYWSDGTTLGQVKADGTVGLWGMNAPPDPVCTAVAAGGLFAGTYQVAMTVIHASGLESGAPRAVSVDVPEGGGIEAVTPAASGVKFALYRTGPQGAQDALRRAWVTDPGTTTTLGVGALGKPLESLFAARPLPGQCLTAHKGRLWGATGAYVWFTSEKSPHWFYPDTGYYQFETAVTMLSSTEDGLYVGLYDRIYFLQGSDPYQMTQRPVSGVGAARNSAMELPYDLFLGEGSFPSKQGAFYDTHGYFCVGKPGGVIMRPTQSRFSAGDTLSGAASYRAYDGLRQVVAVLDRKPGPQTATDVSVERVFSNGVVLNAP